MIDLLERIETYKSSTATAEPVEILEIFLKEFEGKIAFSTSFGAEDQVLTHIILSIDPKCRIFTLDTGRLPEETYRVWERTEARYGITVEPYFPQSGAVEQLVRDQGINGFYQSIENRKRCCRIRKIEPLKRALENMDVWITGLRREQSITRESLQIVEYDENFNLIKLNPLLEWRTGEVWEYIEKNDIPYNSLHDCGYPSIGCAPCTRAVSDKDDIRSGRWWWESPEHKECGLHIKSDRKI